MELSQILEKLLFAQEKLHQLEHQYKNKFKGYNYITRVNLIEKEIKYWQIKIKKPPIITKVIYDLGINKFTIYFHHENEKEIKAFLKAIKPNAHNIKFKKIQTYHNYPIQ